MAGDKCTLLSGGREALRLTQWYLVLPHEVYQVQGSSLRGVEKCPMPNSVRKQIQKYLCFLFLVWNLKKRGGISNLFQ